MEFRGATQSPKSSIIKRKRKKGKTSAKGERPREPSGGFVDAGLDLGAAIGLWMSEWCLFFPSSFSLACLLLVFGL